MSFRELRSFIESMRALGYRRLISVENFRKPNFKLVAELLFWLTTHYDDTADLSDDIRTENARVEFLKACAQIMLTKARIKLNIKNLYRADGFAVIELLKISSLLYDAIQSDATEDSKAASNAESDQSNKLEELRQARTLANDIVDTGIKLYGSLQAEEAQVRVRRERALTFIDSISKNLDRNDPQEIIERSIKEEINALGDNASELSSIVAQLSKDQASLRQKLAAKQADLERHQKRLSSLRRVRPVFMDEYERNENELKAVHESYVERFRNLQYLESELAKYHAAEEEKKQEAERNLKRMQKKIRAEEMRILRGEQLRDDDDGPGGAGGGGGGGFGAGGGLGGLGDHVFNSDNDDEDDDDEEDEDAQESKRAVGGSAAVAGRRSAGAGAGAGGGMRPNAASGSRFAGAGASAAAANQRLGGAGKVAAKQTLSESDDDQDVRVTRDRDLRPAAGGGGGAVVSRGIAGAGGSGTTLGGGGAGIKPGAARAGMGANLGTGAGKPGAGASKPSGGDDDDNDDDDDDDDGVGDDDDDDGDEDDNGGDGSDF